MIPIVFDYRPRYLLSPWYELSCVFTPNYNFLTAYPLFVTLTFIQCIMLYYSKTPGKPLVFFSIRFSIPFLSR
jgi:hypothetical protein